MQVVALETADGVAFDAAVAPLERALAPVGTVGTVTHTDSPDGPPVVVATRPDREYRYPRAKETVAAAIDDLADAGTDYALVAAELGPDAPRVVVGTDSSGDAVATVPPSAVEGGEVDPAVVEAIDGVEPYETLGSLVAAIEDHPASPKAGALATFTGRVRAENLESARTTHLEYEKYDGVADDELEAIRDELTDRDGVFEVLMHHNTGIVPAEEDAVHVVVLAGHRREAFRAVEDGIDLLKARVPIFKKEVTETGEHWAHDRP